MNEDQIKNIIRDFLLEYCFQQELIFSDLDFERIYKLWSTDKETERYL